MTSVAYIKDNDVWKNYQQLRLHLVCYLCLHLRHWLQMPPLTSAGAADAAGDLALTGGGATGVSINIKKADGTNIDINSADSGIALTSAATQQLNFTANYISTSAAVTAGQANAVAQVNISYM